MGTYYTYGASRRDIIKELTETQPRSCGGYFKTVRHCARGNVLWTLHELKANDTVTVFIGCYLLRPDREGWGYKPMDESMGPYYYTCPLAYLEVAPVACQEWRDKVRVYHETLRQRRLHKSKQAQLRF